MKISDINGAHLDALALWRRASCEFRDKGSALGDEPGALSIRTNAILSLHCCDTLAYVSFS